MCVWTSFIYNKTISSQVLCFQANILLVYLWLPCGYLVPSCCNYFGCTSFFVDIYIYHQDFVYIEPYTLERNYISSWYPFFHVHLVFLVISLVAPWKLLPWVRVFYRCILMHSCVWWRLFSSCLSLRGFCHLNWYPSSWWASPRLSSPRVVTRIGSLLLISKLVNPFASCVWEW